MSKGMEVRNSILAGEGQTVEDTEGETEQERKLEASAGARHTERAFSGDGALS